MKKIYLSLICVCLSLAFESKLSAQLLNPTPYCELNLSNQTGHMISPRGSATTGDGITNVTLGTLNNSTNGYLPDSTYLYYNNLPSPILTAGNVYTLSVTFGSSFNSEPMYYTAWIDFNRNNSFESSELMMSHANSGGEITFGTIITHTASFTVPVHAVAGTTRMRVARTSEKNGGFGNYKPAYVQSPCFTIQERTPGINPYGEVEDYNVAITTTVSSVGIETLRDEENVLSAYPNPGSGYFILDAGNLNSGHQEKGLTLSLFAPDGKKVYENITTESLFKVDTSDLPAGIYRLQAIDSCGKRNVLKVVVYSE